MESHSNKKNILIIGLTICFLALIVQIISLQLFDNSYKVNAENNAFRYEVKYPVRGLILDRNGKVLVGNKNVYDIIVTPYDVKPFDTLALCKIFSIEEDFVKTTFDQYRKYRTRIGYQSKTFLKQVSAQKYSLFLEKSHRFPGFSGISRTSRSYSYNAGGNLLGYITEVDPSFINRNPEYKQGDYTGRTGLEEICEGILKGEKGHNIFLRDANNVIQSSYKDGEHDKPAVPGSDVVSTIDAELQNYGELLMKNKVGSVIAIEPSTGEILTMVSSPGIDVSILAEINKHYSDISKDPFKPMYNRAVMSPQPPGSVFKLVNALIGLQERVITTNTRYSCRGERGYRTTGVSVGCHNHSAPTNFEESILMSCNSYYCNLFRNILDNEKYDNIEESFDKWREYVGSFGFGKKLGSDFPSEQAGILPSSKTYNRIYGKRGWKSPTVISLSIGQGEIGSTPLHLANLAATLANRGYYYIPHIIKGNEDSPIDEKYKTKNHTLIDRKHFAPAINGMYRAVNSPPGKGATARIAAVKDLEICGKTGTSENPHGDTHSVFICFAPKNNPKIAIAVYVENAGFGASTAAPIASLLVEKYLNGEITTPSRKWLEKSMIEKYLLHKVPAGKHLANKKKDKK